MKPTPGRKAYYTIEGIPRIARKGESIVVDPRNKEGILVGRWVSWSELDHLMRHADSMRVDGEFEKYKGARHQDRVGGATEKEPEPKTTENRYLRLKFEGEYRSGDSFRDFELLVDAPEVPVTRLIDVKPRHAIKGDVLRERHDDNLTPFELCRGSKRIGDPEWWQVRHLFVGLDDRADEPEGHGETRVDPALARLHQLSRDALRRPTSRFLATSSIPGTIVAAGDYLTFSSFARKDPEVTGAVALRVPRAQLATVAEHFDSLRVLHVPFNPSCTTAADQLEYIGTRLRRRQNPKWRDATSRLIVIRPLVAPVSEPIAAGSDDAALFEFIHSSGGKMPPALSANVRETRSTQRIRVGRRQRKRTCWDCEREWKRMVVPLESGRPSEARQLLRTRR